MPPQPKYDTIEAAFEAMVEMDEALLRADPAVIHTARAIFAFACVAAAGVGMKHGPQELLKQIDAFARDIVARQLATENLLN